MPFEASGGSLEISGIPYGWFSLVSSHHLPSVCFSFSPHGILSMRTLVILDKHPLHTQYDLILFNYTCNYSISKSDHILRY